jgi:hypothetical protein
MSNTDHPVVIPIGLIFMLIAAVCGLLKGCSSSFRTGTIVHSKYVSIEDVYGRAPTYSTQKSDWTDWESKYIGRYVTGAGKVSAFSIHPHVGKLFFVLTISGEKGATENNTRQVALLLEDAHNVKLGDKEGSLLIDGTKWINLGENYAFEGRVSGFSAFDAELVTAGYRGLIVVKAKMMDIRKE